MVRFLDTLSCSGTKLLAQAQHELLSEALELCDKVLALWSGLDTPFVADTFGVMPPDAMQFYNVR